MHRISPRRTVTLFLLAAVLAAPLALWAGPPAGGPPAAAAAEGSSSKILRPFWDLLAFLWQATGCHIDPGGGCAASPRPAAAADEGCHIDPDGCARARTTPPAAVDHGDTGCHIDPDGCPR
jgi:hypothetical protein